MDVFWLLEYLATLLLTENQIDSIVHDKLFLENLLYLINFLDLIKIYRHLKLLIVASFNQTFGPHKSEDNHSHILLVVFLLLWHAL